MRYFFSLDSRQPDAKHACVIGNDENMHDLPGVHAQVGNQILLWKTPVTEGNLFAQKVQARVDLAFQWCVWLLMTLGLYAYLNYLFFDMSRSDTVASVLLETRDPRILLFWIGTLAGITLYSVKKRQGKSTRPLPRKTTQMTHSDLDEATLSGKATHAFSVDQSLTPQASNHLAHSFELAKSLCHARVLPLHIFLAAKETPEMEELCTRLAMNREELIQKTERLLHERSGEKSVLPSCTQEFYEVLLVAALESMRESRPTITLTELLIEIGRAHV